VCSSCHAESGGTGARDSEEEEEGDGEEDERGGEKSGGQEEWDREREQISGSGRDGLGAVSISQALL
jgi:hypothetical protein